MARTLGLYNARFTASSGAWWDKTTDAATWEAVAAMTGKPPIPPDVARARWRNMVAVANDILYWVGDESGVPTLFSFDGTTQTTLGTFPDDGDGPATDGNSVCAFDNNIYALVGYQNSGNYLLYRWNPETSALTGPIGGESVIHPGTGGHLTAAMGLLWLAEIGGVDGLVWRLDPRTSGNWVVDAVHAAQPIAAMGEYKGSLFIADRATSGVTTTARILSKNSVTGAFAARVASVVTGADDNFDRFLPDETNGILLAHRSDLTATSAIWKSTSGLTAWASEVDLVAVLSVDPTQAIGQGAVFSDKQYFGYLNDSSGFLIQRNAGTYTSVHAGPIELGMGAINSPAPPSTERPFSLVQAGDKVYGLTLSGDFSKEITLPSGVTIDGTKRIRFTVLSRKIVIAGAEAISEPIWVYPKTLVGYKLRQGTPDAPVLTGGAVNAPCYGWVTFIQKLDGFLVNESPLSDPSDQSTSRIFTNIDTPAVGTDWTGRRLYRSLGNGTIPFQAVDIDDTTTTTFDTNSISDAALQLNPSDPELGEAPSDMDLLTTWRNRAWARSATDGQQDNAYFSAVGNYYAWNPDNFLPAQPLGEDVFGITGFLARRDELGITKRSRILKVVGTGIDADFDVIVVADGIGCVSADSCVVIRDIGYFLGVDGPYTFGPQGITPIFDTRVVPWFQSDQYFNRAMFPNAVGGYNPLTDSYDLHLASVGSTVLDRWVSFNIKRREWLGPHRTEAFLPTGRGMLRDEDGAYQPSFGGHDGFIYKMNQPGASDEGNAILVDWILSWLSANAPDITHRWLRSTLYVRIEPSATGTLVVTPRVGGLNAPDGTPQEVPLTIDRTVLARFGVGRLLRLQFQHSTDGENLFIEALEIPFNEAGRR